MRAAEESKEASLRFSVEDIVDPDFIEKYKLSDFFSHIQVNLDPISMHERLGVKKFEVTFNEVRHMKMLKAMNFILETLECREEGCMNKPMYLSRSYKSIVCEDHVDKSEIGAEYKFSWGSAWIPSIKKNRYDLLETEKDRCITKFRCLQKEVIKQQSVAAFLKPNVVLSSIQTSLYSDLARIEDELEDIGRIFTMYEQHKSEKRSSPFEIFDEYLSGVKEHLKSYQEIAGAILYKYFSDLLYKNMVDQESQEEQKYEESDFLLLDLLSQKHEIGFLMYNSSAKLQSEIAHLTKFWFELVSKLHKSLKKVEHEHKMDLQTITRQAEEVKQKAEEKENEAREFIKLNTLDKKAFEQIYKDVKKKSVTINSGFRLVLNLENEQDVKLMNALSKYRLPQIKAIEIYNVEEHNKELDRFLKMWIPKSLQEFCIKFNNTSEWVQTNYYEAILETAPKVRSKFYLYSWSLDQSQVVSLLAATKHWQSIGFPHSQLSLGDGMDFGDSLDNAIFEKLDLSNTIHVKGYRCYWDEGGFPLVFKNLFEALGRVESVKKNLKFVKFKNCELNSLEVQKKMKVYGFDEIVWKLK